MFNTLDFYFKNERKFRRNKNIWYRKKDKIFILCEYQKSSTWTDAFYLNLGIYFEEFRGNRKGIPKSDEWHFRTRYSKLINVFDEKVIEEPIKAEVDEAILNENLKCITENLDKLVLPYLDKLSDYKYLSKIHPKELYFENIWVQNATADELLIFFQSKSIEE